jgi:hypothetical protein
MLPDMLCCAINSCCKGTIHKVVDWQAQSLPLMNLHMVYPAPELLMAGVRSPLALCATEQ